MWGGPTPHNLVILCLCYANRTSSEVPISSSNRATARLGRGDRILLPSVTPAQVQGRHNHNTTRSTLTIGYPPHNQRRQTRRRITPGIPPFMAIVSVDRMRQEIWGGPVQSSRHPQALILSQKPRRKQKNSCDQHVQWVQEEIETLEKAGIIAKSVSPWASPIVIVPKKTAPGEPPRRRMCVDYRMLNQLLPKVDKAHSKARGF